MKQDKKYEVQVIERDDLIAAKYFIQGMKQADIAKEFKLTQAGVSCIVQKYKKDEALRKKLVTEFEKDYSLEARRKAGQLMDKVNPEDHPKSKLVMDSAILMDKARLIDSTASKQVDIRIMIQHLAEGEQQLATIYKRMGRELPINVTPYDPLDHLTTQGSERPGRPQALLEPVPDGDEEESD